MFVRVLFAALEIWLGFYRSTDLSEKDRQWRRGYFSNRNWLPVVPARGQSLGKRMMMPGIYRSPESAAVGRTRPHALQVCCSGAGRSGNEWFGLVLNQTRAAVAAAVIAAAIAVPSEASLTLRGLGAQIPESPTSSPNYKLQASRWQVRTSIIISSFSQAS